SPVRGAAAQIATASCAARVLPLATRPRAPLRAMGPGMARTRANKSTRCARSKCITLAGEMSSFSHIDPASARPTMVDVGDKAVTKRSATALTEVRFPASVANALRAQDFNTPKGPVFHTAIIAGTMAAKRTHELIP